MKKLLLLSLIGLSFTATALEKEQSSTGHVAQPSTSSYFARTKERALQSQSIRIAVLEKERECTKKTVNREQLYACVRISREAMNAMHEKQLASVRKQYSLTGQTSAQESAK